MKSLDKFDYFMVTALLNLKGFEFEQEIANRCELWYNPNLNKHFTIKRNSEKISEKYLINILNQAGINLNEFMELI